MGPKWEEWRAEAGLNNDEQQGRDTAIGCIKKLKNSKSDLLFLDLSNNQLTTLPDSLDVLLAVNLKTSLELRWLNLSNNSLTTLPDSIGLLSELDEITLTNNKINTLPKSISRLSKLEHLHLGKNALKNIPEVIFSLPSTCNVYVENNPIPESEIHRIRQRMDASSYQGPNILFSTPNEYNDSLSDEEAYDEYTSDDSISMPGPVDKIVTSGLSSEEQALIEIARINNIKISNFSRKGKWCYCVLGIQADAQKAAIKLARDKRLKLITPCIRTADTSDDAKKAHQILNKAYFLLKVMESTL